MKIKVLFLILSGLVLTPLFSLEIYDHKKKELDLEVEFTGSYNYSAELFPGLSEFKIDKADITLTGTYNDNLELELEYDVSDNQLKDAKLEYQFFNRVDFTAGLFKVKYGKQNSSKKQPSNRDSDATSNFTPGRTIGVAFSGDNLFKFINYNLSFTNDPDSDYNENNTGHHQVTAMIDTDIELNSGYAFNPGYNILYNSNEIFSHGLFLELTTDYGLYLLLEYLEQRYYNYYWNRSIYASAAYEIKESQPYIALELYDDYSGEETDDDSFNTELGFNKSLIGKHLSLNFSYTNEFKYSQSDSLEQDIISRMNHILKIGISCEL